MLSSPLKTEQNFNRKGSVLRACPGKAWRLWMDVMPTRVSWQAGYVPVSHGPTTGVGGTGPSAVCPSTPSPKRGYSREIALVRLAAAWLCLRGASWKSIPQPRRGEHRLGTSERWRKGPQAFTTSPLPARLRCSSGTPRWNCGNAL